MKELNRKPKPFKTPPIQQAEALVPIPQIKLLLLDIHLKLLKQDR
ncbi:hypothetical protein [Wolbachia endosymbiont of Trichogramma kaykai]